MWLEEMTKRAEWEQAGIQRLSSGFYKVKRLEEKERQEKESTGATR